MPPALWAWGWLDCEDSVLRGLGTRQFLPSSKITLTSELYFGLIMLFVNLGLWLTALGELTALGVWGLLGR